MASHITPSLSAGDAAGLAARMAYIVIRSLFASAWELAFTRPAEWPRRRTVAVSYLRQYIAMAMPRRLALAMHATTGDAIKAFCKAQGLSHRAIDIASEDGIPNATLHHVTTEPASQLRKGETTYLYFHGGGYIDPMSSLAHPPFTIKTAEKAGCSSTIFLEYALAPQIKYPGQLIQAANALNHLLLTLNAEDIVIGGDSAGGNLVLALIAHIKQPKRGVPPVTGMNGSFLGALLISPWVSTEYEASSYVSSRGVDYLNKEAMILCNQYWKPSLDEVWASPLIGDEHFWTALPVTNVLLTAGAWEAFRDDIFELARKMGAKTAGTRESVQLAVAEKEVHVQCVVDAAFGYEGGFMTKSIMQWMSSLRK